MKRIFNLSSFFQHKDCEFFPCHASIDPERLNCLFCYCPLYALDERCGGAFSYTADGDKDCSDCVLPHDKDNFQRVIDRFPDISQMMRMRREGI